MVAVIDDLAQHATTGTTPRRIFREHVARRRLEQVAAVRDGLSRPTVTVQTGFSFKTNPRRELVTLARLHGFLAETIARDELEWAARVGFPPEETIYNGPEPLLDRKEGERLALAYADSIEAFARNARLGVAHVHGVRLRPAMIGSRFGVSVEDDPDLRAAVDALPAAMPIAVSFHARREDFHGASWRDVAADVLERAAEIERRTGRHVVAFDVGGGWTPEQFDADFAADMGWVLDRIAALLPHCTRLIAEPGQAVCTPTEAIVTEVLEVRERRGRREAIADVGYEDWPEMHGYCTASSSGAARAGSRSAAARTGWAAEPASSTIWSTGCASRPTWPSGTACWSPMPAPTITRWHSNSLGVAESTAR